jgi:hypothetical protein
LQRQEHERSGYSPLDLFSDERERLITAITSLFNCPQNNLSLFWNRQRCGVDLCSLTAPLEHLFPLARIVELLPRLISLIVVSVGRSFRSRPKEA